jgi:hypothetical protein
MLQRAWKKLAAPKGMPSRAQSVFAAVHYQDWKTEMSLPFVYAIKPSRGAKITVRDARYGARCFAALRQHYRAQDPKEQRRWLAIAWRAAKDYWREPGDAPGAWPEVLIGNKAIVEGTLNEPHIKAFLKKVPTCSPEKLAPYPGTPQPDQQRADVPAKVRAPKTARPEKTAPKTSAPNPFLDPVGFTLSFWFGGS